MKDTTVVITSCGRHDLLERTLDSLLHHNTYPIAGIFIIEDGDPFVDNRLVDKYVGEANIRGIETIWVCTGERVGQIKAIDMAYTWVKTPYVFHCEDDWEFYRPGFIEASKAILEDKPKCLQVWLRDREDTNGHPITWGDAYGVMNANYKRQWHGFSFNPGLRRMSDYNQIGGGYSSIATFKRTAPWESEIAIGRYYHRLGMWAAILPEGYVRHTGDGRHVS